MPTGGEDTDGWAQLYAAVAPSAMSFAYALCAGDRSAAEDLFHDVFLKCARRRRMLDDSLAFERYLRRSMVNAAIDLSRREHSRRQWLSRQSRQVFESDGQDAIAERDSLIRALRLLPPRQRAAVVVRTCLDLSEAEAAEVLGCSVGTVKSLASRGLAALRLHLNEPEVCDG
jgi:RNA polymerase sigma-70 factor (sigma-E family)